MNYVAYNTLSLSQQFAVNYGESTVVKYVVYTQCL